MKESTFGVLDLCPDRGAPEWGGERGPLCQRALVHASQLALRLGPKSQHLRVGVVPSGPDKDVRT